MVEKEGKKVEKGKKSEVAGLAEQQKHLIMLFKGRNIIYSEYIRRYRDIQERIWEVMGRNNKEVLQCPKQTQR